MNKSQPCKLCGEIAVIEFFEREQYPIWGGPVLSAAQSEHLKFAPLRIGICSRCAFMSLTAPTGEELPDLLYADFYSSSNPVCEDPENISDWRVTQLLELINGRMKGIGRQALEIASYDGQFLYQLRKHGWEVSGCEPNPIGQQAASRYGFSVKQSYFHIDLYPPASFDLIVCRFVLEHVPEPLDFLKAAWLALKPGGVVFIEVPDGADRVINRVLGSFVPEHVSYFCQSSLEAALLKQGFVNPEFKLYQGGIIVSASRPENGQSAAPEPGDVSDLVASATSFEADAADRIDQLRMIVEELSAQHKRIAIYGANTQTIEYFNRGGIHEDQVSYIIDDDPYKQGLQLVGTRLPVAPINKLKESPVEAIVVSAYLSQGKMANKVRDIVGTTTSIVTFYPFPSIS